MNFFLRITYNYIDIKIIKVILSTADIKGNCIINSACRLKVSTSVNRCARIDVNKRNVERTIHATGIRLI